MVSIDKINPLTRPGLSARSHLVNKNLFKAIFLRGSAALTLSVAMAGIDVMSSCGLSDFHSRYMYPFGPIGNCSFFLG